MEYKKPVTSKKFKDFMKNHPNILFIYLILDLLSVFFIKFILLFLAVATKESMK